MREFTRRQLKQYDGQNGHKAYVAVDGIVYDVSDISAWKVGMHHGHVAGNDLSREILNAPHGKQVLAKLTKVGKLID